MQCFGGQDDMRKCRDHDLYSIILLDAGHRKIVFKDYAYRVLTGIILDKRLRC